MPTNDNVTISTAQLLALFPDEQTARHYLELRRWPNGVRCPTCNSDRIGAHSPGLYRCNACEEAFSVRTGTVMERSKIPLTQWLHAMYLLVTARARISSMQLSAELSLRQASAWFLLHRLREACGKNLDTLRGIVEVDETYIGGRARRRPAHHLRRVGEMKTPTILDAAVDAMLAAKPKPRTRQAKKRARRQRKIQRKSSG